MKDSNSAFPFQHEHREQTRNTSEGMTIRDYFAAHALTGLVTIFGIPQEGCRTLSKRAYEIADSMLRAREVK